MYTRPTKGYSIYTKSNCPACDEAKQLLPDATLINCDEYLQDADAFLDFIWSLCDKDYPKTFPMVFLDGVYLKEYKNTFTLTADF